MAANFHILIVIHGKSSALFILHPHPDFWALYQTLKFNEPFQTSQLNMARNTTFECYFLVCNEYI